MVASCPHFGPSPQRWSSSGDAERGAAGGGARDHRKLHLRGSGRNLSEVAGPQEAVTVGYVAAGAPLLVAVPVSDDRIDDAALQFLLQQCLLALAEEEENAREEAEVKELEEVVAKRMQRLAEEFRGRVRSQLSDLERIACALVAHSAVLAKKKEKRKKKKRRRRWTWRSLFSCSS